MSRKSETNVTAINLFVVVTLWESPWSKSISLYTKTLLYIRASISGQFSYSRLICGPELSNWIFNTPEWWGSICRKLESTQLFQLLGKLALILTFSSLSLLIQTPKSLLIIRQLVLDCLKINNNKINLMFD